MHGTGTWSRLRQLAMDEGGNVALILTIIAAPLTGIAGLAIDMGRVTSARSTVQHVADGAALAAAVARGSNAERETVGKAYIAMNMPDLFGVATSPTITVAADGAHVEIDAVVDGTLLASIFTSRSSQTRAARPASSSMRLPAVEFAVTAEVEVEEGDTAQICVLALNQSIDDAIYIRGTGDFTADNCDVHANSASSSAIHLQGDATATAESFTAVGGWQVTGGAGSFSVTPEGGQSAIGDPFMIDVSDPGGAASTTTVKKKDGNTPLADTKYSDITIQAGGQATFTPGVHYITGTLSVGSQGALAGTDVTLVLLGSSATIDMGSGAIIQLQAPADGTYPGFAVIGDRNAGAVQTNTVQGGASSYIRGVWYTPKHKLYVTGGGDFNQDSAYFPIIADTIEIGGNGAFHVGYDGVEYGFAAPDALTITRSGKVRLTD
jgi:Flp pilus assembly protein TadG